MGDILGRILLDTSTRFASHILKFENVFYFIIFIRKFIINLLTLSLFIDRYPTSDLFGVESNTAKWMCRNDEQFIWHSIVPLFSHFNGIISTKKIWYFQFIWWSCNGHNSAKSRGSKKWRNMAMKMWICRNLTAQVIELFGEITAFFHPYNKCFNELFKL